MKVLIIEDEQMAQANLIRNLNQGFDDIQIIGTASSVSAAVAWLKNGENKPDTIFMDVELGDGDCFTIFKEVEIKANVVMTTAYDSYAIKAFEAGSIDYLLKPIDPAALQRAVSRCRARLSVPDANELLKAMENNARQYRNRITVHVGDRIIPVSCEDIAWFHSENKSNYVTTRDGTCYIMDSSMDSIEEALDPEEFFRTSRGCIISKRAIRSVSKHISGRLRIVADPEPPVDITVARARVEDFRKWFEK